MIGPNSASRYYKASKIGKCRTSKAEQDSGYRKPSDYLHLIQTAYPPLETRRSINKILLKGKKIMFPSYSIITP